MAHRSAHTSCDNGVEIHSVGRIMCASLMIPQPDIVHVIGCEHLLSPAIMNHQGVIRRVYIASNHLPSVIDSVVVRRENIGNVHHKIINDPQRMRDAIRTSPFIRRDQGDVIHAARIIREIILRTIFVGSIQEVKVPLVGQRT